MSGQSPLVTKCWVLLCDTKVQRCLEIGRLRWAQVYSQRVMVEVKLEVRVGLAWGRADIFLMILTFFHTSNFHWTLFGAEMTAGLIPILQYHGVGGATGSKRPSQVLWVITEYSRHDSVGMGNCWEELLLRTKRNSWRMSWLRAALCRMRQPSGQGERYHFKREGYRAPKLCSMIRELQNITAWLKIHMAGESGDWRSGRFKLWGCLVWPVVQFELYYCFFLSTVLKVI